MAECRVALLGVMTVALAAAATPVSAGAEPRAVVELFTSQGCSSCPAADQLLGELGHDPSIITMSLPIDYWDYIGWKDTLALPGHTKRQWAYAHALGDRGVYTPQAIVNGSVQVVGSDRTAIESAIGQSHKHAEALSLPVSLAVVDGQIKITAAESKTPSSGEVWLCSLSKAVPVVIGRGENHGRTITYHNVVRRWIRVGEWTGSAGTWNIPLKDVQADGVDEVAVVVQAGNTQNPGAMLGAAITALH
jgi:hypothetical protein